MNFFLQWVLKITFKLFIFASFEYSPPMKAEIGKDIKKARDYIRKGEVVAVPTETVYGLAADIQNEEAIRKVFEIKNRPLYNPLIVHFRDGQQLVKYVDYDRIIMQAETLAVMSKFTPGPLTVILPKNENVPDIVTAGADSVAVRIPAQNTTMHKLIKAVGRPLVAPSANLFGKLSPTKAEHVMAQLGDKIPYILEGDEDIAYGVESTIVSFIGREPKILRVGAIPKEEIEKVLRRRLKVEDKVKTHPLAPGMLGKHYAPKTHLVLFSPKIMNKIGALVTQYRVGILDLNKSLSAYKDKAAAYLDLSLEGHLDEAARNLYDYLYQLDRQNLDFIIVASIRNTGLGRTINDRLKRAAKGD